MTVARFTAALDIEYPVILSNSALNVNSGPPSSEVMTKHFFVEPARMSGRNALMRWMMPKTFVLNCQRGSFVSIFGKLEIFENRGSHECNEILVDQFLRWAIVEVESY